MAGQDDSVLNQAAVREAAVRHGKTPAQVVLRWAAQRGTALVTKTVRPERLAENLALFDFELLPDEMAAISSLNCDRRFNDPDVFCEEAFRTLCPVYE
jgi:D-xylose reductase